MLARLRIVHTAVSRTGQDHKNNATTIHAPLCQVQGVLSVNSLSMDEVCLKSTRVWPIAIMAIVISIDSSETMLQSRESCLSARRQCSRFLGCCCCSWQGMLAVLLSSSQSVFSFIRCCSLPNRCSTSFCTQPKVCQHSSSFSRRLGMPLLTMNLLPVSGHTNAPSSSVISRRAW